MHDTFHIGNVLSFLHAPTHRPFLNHPSSDINILRVYKALSVHKNHKTSLLRPNFYDISKVFMAGLIFVKDLKIIFVSTRLDADPTHAKADGKENYAIFECRIPDGFKESKKWGYLPIGTGVMYLGCYWSVVIEKTTPVQSYTDCKSFCLSVKNIFMIGLQRGEACHCLSSAKYPVSSSHCDRKCPNDHDRCGGLEFFSVFQIKERLDFSKSLVSLDEFDVSTSNHSQVSVLELTIDKCISICFERNLPYATLKNEPGNEPLCYCSKPSDDTAAIKCLSNSEAVRHFEFQTAYSRQSRCKIIDGIKCTECEAGWIGVLCGERDCSANSDVCRPLTCRKTVALGKEYSECVCQENYYKEHFSKCSPLPKTVNLAFGKKITAELFDRNDFSASSLDEAYLITSNWEYTVDGNMMEWEFVSLLYLKSSLESVECGKYPMSLGNCNEHDAISINCTRTEQKSRFVIIQKDVEEQDSVFAFSEVEVYGADKKQNQFAYVGCFEKFRTFNSSKDENLGNDEQCHKYCAGFNIENFIFAIHVASAKEQDMEIFDKRNGHGQLDEQQS
ncbi:hypothetical protein HELRODRAFT_178956 [Helobdella robusta]|uniref:WSC domain-containing protein n=1 Tax=Helobdella robusta TaxID=6412 RepID=T1FDY6_HELRO|nr:hypothetical protein HELRODRAFT_178956 [Helobdella robusta]ESN95775.1 hypothetical protein HELRODRAFT_178956 [Helobdella robusta]